MCLYLGGLSFHPEPSFDFFVELLSFFLSPDFLSDFFLVLIVLMIFFLGSSGTKSFCDRLKVDLAVGTLNNSFGFLVGLFKIYV